MINNLRRKYKFSFNRTPVTARRILPSRTSCHCFDCMLSSWMSVRVSGPKCQRGHWQHLRPAMPMDRHHGNSSHSTVQYCVCVFVWEFGTNKQLERGAHKLYEPRQWRSEGHSRLRVERVHYPESSSSFLTVESHIKSFEFEFSKHDNHWRRPLYKMAWVTAEPEVPVN